MWLLLCSPSAARQRRKLPKCFPSPKGFASSTAVLSSAHFRLSHSGILPLVFLPPPHPSPSLQVAASGGFPWRLETVRHLGFGFCLLGELAEPIVYLHCSCLTLLGPRPCSCSSSGRCKTGRRVRMMPAVSQKAGVPEGWERRGDGEGPGQSPNRTFEWYAVFLKKKNPRIPKKLTEMQRRPGRPG